MLLSGPTEWGSWQPHVGVRSNLLLRGVFVVMYLRLRARVGSDRVDHSTGYNSKLSMSALPQDKSLSIRKHSASAAFGGLGQEIEEAITSEHSLYPDATECNHVGCCWESRVR